MTSQLEITLDPQKQFSDESDNISILPHMGYVVSSDVFGLEGEPFSACFGVIILDKYNHELMRKIEWLNDFSGKRRTIKVIFATPDFGDHIRIIYRINVETPMKSKCRFIITPPTEANFEIKTGDIEDITTNDSVMSITLYPKNTYLPKQLQEECDKIRWWLSMPLAPGVMTKGQMPVLELLPYLGIPENLKGKRVLDIGCSDGFFSFLAEQLGAKVVAIDPFPSPGFQFAHKVLNSNVEYLRMGVYEISPQKLGTFDVVFFLGVYYHLKHPTLAMERIASVTKDFVIVESAILVSPNTEGMPVSEYLETEKPGNDAGQYFIPTTNFLLRTVRGGGFPNVKLVSRFFHSQRGNRAVVRGYKTPLTSNKILSESIHIGITEPKPYSVNRSGRVILEGSIVDDSNLDQGAVKNVQVFLDGLPNEGLFLGEADIAHLSSSKSERWELPSHRYELSFNLPQTQTGKHLLYILAYTDSGWNFHSVPIVIEP